MKTIRHVFSRLMIASLAICALAWASGCSSVGGKNDTRPLALGKLLSVKETGIKIGNTPLMDLTVQFTTADGQQITTSKRARLALTDATQLQQTGVVPIRYDPQKPAEIAFDWNADEAALVKAWYQNLVATGKWTQQNLDTWEKGVRANGVIMSSHPTGKIIQGSAEMELHVRITRPDNSTFDVTVTEGVPQDGVALTAAGSVVPVAYMPNDEKDVVIDFYQKGPANL